MADSTTQTGGQDVPGNRATGEESDSQRGPGRNESMTDRVQGTDVTEMVRSGDPIALAAMGSVALAWFQFYVRKKRTHGLFIGLWAPTLLAMASYVDRRANESQD